MKSILRVVGAVVAAWLVLSLLRRYWRVAALVVAAMVLASAAHR